MKRHQRKQGKPATLTIRASIPQDISYLAPRLRNDDLQALLSAGSPSPKASLSDGLHFSDVCLTALGGTGQPVLMFGTVPHPQEPDTGIVWLLGTDEIENHKTDFLRKSLEYLEVFHRKYSVLMNFTDARNEKQHQWARWCGFEFLGEIKGKGPGGLPFYKITKRKDAPCAIH
jgi:hypothetical protein